MASLQDYMQANFSNAADSNSYRIIPNTASRVHNCFAYAVGVTDRRISPYTRINLIQTCEKHRLQILVSSSLTGLKTDAQLGYFPVDNGTLVAGDVEVFYQVLQLWTITFN
jgi:hypothetical protein